MRTEWAVRRKLGRRGPDVEGRAPRTGVAPATVAVRGGPSGSRSGGGRPRLAPHCFPASSGGEPLLGYEIALLTARGGSRASLSHC